MIDFSDVKEHLGEKSKLPPEVSLLWQSQLVRTLESLPAVAAFGLGGPGSRGQANPALLGGKGCV